MKYIKDIIKVIFVLVIVIVVSIGHFQAFRQFRKGDRITEQLITITPEMIQRIEVYKDDYGKDLTDIPKVNSTASKELFAKAMHDLEKYSPNHDKSTQHFRVWMFTETGDKHEFSIWLKQGVTGTAYMHMMETTYPDGNYHSKNLGGRKSAGLYQWLDHHKLIK